MKNGREDLINLQKYLLIRLANLMTALYKKKKVPLHSPYSWKLSQNTACDVTQSNAVTELYSCNDCIILSACICNSFLHRILS